MKKVFTNSVGNQLIFLDDGLAFLGPREDVYYPYGSLDALRMNLIGDVEAVGGVSICCFECEKEQRGELRKMIHFARKARKTAPKEDKVVVDLRKRNKQHWLPENATNEELLTCYQALFVKGAITREEYAFRKKLLQAKDD